MQVSGDGLGTGLKLDTCTHPSHTCANSQSDFLFPNRTHFPRAHTHCPVCSHRRWLLGTRSTCTQVWRFGALSAGMHTGHALASTHVMHNVGKNRRSSLLTFCFHNCIYLILHDWHWCPKSGTGTVHRQLRGHLNWMQISPTSVRANKQSPVVSTQLGNLEVREWARWSLTFHFTHTHLHRHTRTHTLTTSAVDTPEQTSEQRQPWKLPLKCHVANDVWYGVTNVKV